MSRPNPSQDPKPPDRPIWLLIVFIVIAIAIVLAIVAAMTSGSSSPQTGSAPRAEVAQTSIDHGNVSFEQPVESVFVVRNTGDQPLVIFGEPRVELVEGC